MALMLNLLLRITSAFHQHSAREGIAGNAPAAYAYLQNTRRSSLAASPLQKSLFIRCDSAEADMVLAGQSMKHHLLSSYFHAVLSVALAQFGTSGFAHGTAGIVRLAEGSPYVQVSLLSTPSFCLHIYFGQRQGLVLLGTSRILQSDTLGSLQKWHI